MSFKNAGLSVISVIKVGLYAWLTGKSMKRLGARELSHRYSYRTFCRLALVFSLFLALLRFFSATSCGLRPAGPILSSVEPREIPLPQLFNAWGQIVIETVKLSAKCKELVLYTVTVLSSRAERHHYSVVEPPNITRPECAILLALSTFEGDDLRADEIDANHVVDTYKAAGWIVVHASAYSPAIFSRRLSRLPKISPEVFFPHTRAVLYSDVKMLKTISNIEAGILANRLLFGTQFGIIQHTKSIDLESEFEAILYHSKRRPYIVDSTEGLSLQVARLNFTLDRNQLLSFGVEGSLHARILSDQDMPTSTVINKVWLEEFLSGSDRDQIAFYAAASRLKFFRETPFLCDTFERSGLYRSELVNTTLAIHCALDPILLLG